MKRKIKRFEETYIIPGFMIFVAFFIASLSNNDVLGFIILTLGILNGWYAGLGKWYNYLFGAGFMLLNSYVSFKAHLYGIAFLSLFLYLPLQLHGLFDWHSKKNKNDSVKIRSFTTTVSILITICCIAGSVALGLILKRLPNQELAFLDGASNAMNICAIILMNLRFRECWWVQLGNNVIDLTIWIINFALGIPNSLMMLIVSICYFVLNIVGLFKWERVKNKKWY
jgi:nicotinamide mononucleotide transporter PnuC